jgi:hypothetical protein
MDWENIPENIDEWFGFIYLIERLNAKLGEKKYYYGCKLLKKTIKLSPLKGKKRKTKKITDSDWRDYYGSSEELKKDVEKYGKKNFKRTILKMVTCKWQLKFEELRIQMENNAIFRDDCYNSMLNVRLGKIPNALKSLYKTSFNCI